MFLSLGVVGTLGLVAWTSSLALDKAKSSRSSSSSGDRDRHTVNVGGSMWSRLDKEMKRSDSSEDQKHK